MSEAGLMIMGRLSKHNPGGDSPIPCPAGALCFGGSRAVDFETVPGVAECDQRLQARVARPRPPAGFTPRTLAFLRALERNNRREWFHERKDRYESDVRAPMVALVERLAADFADFAPDLVASPRASIYRPYRDTRFSANKAPLKTNVAAIFPHRLLPKHEGRGFLRGGGAASRLVRRRDVHAVERRSSTRCASTSPPNTDACRALSARRLQAHVRRARRRAAAAGAAGVPARPPGGRLPEVQAVSRRLRTPGRVRHEPGFYRALLAAFRALAPLVEFLNEPLVAGLKSGALGSAWTDLNE